MDYTSAQACASYPQPTAARPLERISLAVNKVNTAVVRVGNFIDRFHGEAPQAPNQGSSGDMVSPPYGVGMEQLFSALERLETRLDALEAIG